VKRLLKTVAALAALAIPSAAAADAGFPKDMLGVWCHDGTKYVRGDCTRENDSWMLLSPRSIEWIESGCRRHERPHVSASAKPRRWVLRDQLPLQGSAA